MTMSRTGIMGRTSGISGALSFPSPSAGPADSPFSGSGVSASGLSGSSFLIGSSVMSIAPPGFGCASPFVLDRDPPSPSPPLLAFRDAQRENPPLQRRAHMGHVQAAVHLEGPVEPPEGPLQAEEGDQRPARLLDLLPGHLDRHPLDEHPDGAHRDPGKFQPDRDPVLGLVDIG